MSGSLPTFLLTPPANLTREEVVQQAQAAAEDTFGVFGHTTPVEYNAINELSKDSTLTSALDPAMQSLSEVMFPDELARHDVRFNAVVQLKEHVSKLVHMVQTDHNKDVLTPQWVELMHQIAEQMTLVKDGGHNLDHVSAAFDNLKTVCSKQALRYLTSTCSGKFKHIVVLIKKMVASGEDKFGKCVTPKDLTSDVCQQITKNGGCQCVLPKW